MDMERLQRCINDIVLDALWETPMFVRDDDEVRLQIEDVIEWSSRVNGLFMRAKTNKWLPEEI